MFLFLSFLWFFKEVKTVLFWFYLWQLKEYHLGRFFDHFRTEKGKHLFLNFPQFLKIFFISGYFLFPLFFPFILILIYFIELLSFLKNIFQKRLIKPVFTKKIIFIFLAVIIGIILILNFLLYNSKNYIEFSLGILLIDIFAPFIISLIIFIFQPLASLGRSMMVKKAKKKMEQFKDLLVIGITGSYGKTSTKEFLYTILAEKFGKDKVLKTKEHQNSEVGVSQCVLNDLKKEHKIFVCEMASYNRGGIRLLCDITKPKIGILTGVNEQHLSTQGSQENIIKTKYELIESLPEQGTAIFNGENFYCLELYQKTQKPKIICNINKTIGENYLIQSDFWVEDLKIEKESVFFKMFSKDSRPITVPQTQWMSEDSADFKINLLGAQNVENLLLAAACAKKLGMNLKEVSLACEKISPNQGGMKLIQNKDGLNIIDSTYSANHNGVISHLDYLKIWEGKKVIVMPCLIELGRATIEVHKKIGRKIGEICASVKEPAGSNGTSLNSCLAIIATKERFKDLKEGAIEKGMEEENILFLENPKKIFEKIKEFCKSNDVVLLEGRLPKQLIDLLK